MDENRIADLKEQLVLHIEGTAQWRSDKAQEYPEDIHNLKAEKALNALADYIKSLPNDHSLFLSMVFFWERENPNAEIISADEDDMIRIYGYKASPDPEAFVNQLIQLYESELKELNPKLDIIH
jgi:hypothetical protein